MRRRHLLVLAGTWEARVLCEALAGDKLFYVTASLAGETLEPASFACPVRLGGFGGAEGLERYLRAEHVDAVVDATHPFATYPTTVRAVCDQLGLPRLRLVRPAWTPRAGERWHQVESFEAAAEAIPADARALLTTGRKSRAAFQRCRAAWLGLRVIDPPESPPWHPQGVYLVKRPPFTLEEETRLMREHAVTHLVTRNAGGAAGRSKVEAAAKLGVEVIMIRRPPAEPGPSASTVEQATAWLADLADAAQVAGGFNETTKGERP